MNSYKNYKIAFIDIDNTLLKGQTQNGLINFLYKKGELSLFFVVKLNLWFFLYKIHLVKDVKKIGDFAISYTKGKTVSDFENLVREYFKNEVLDNIYQDSFQLIENLRKNNVEVFLLSSAIEPIVKQFATLFCVRNYICTSLEENNLIYTGRFSNGMVYGLRKLDLVLERVKLMGFSMKEVLAYADHKSDLPLLCAVGKGFLVNPNNIAKRIALRSGIDIITMQ